MLLLPPLVCGGVIPRLSAQGADVRHGGRPLLPLPAARLRISAVVPRPRPQRLTSAPLPANYLQGISAIVDYYVEDEVAVRVRCGCKYMQMYLDPQ